MENELLEYGNFISVFGGFYDSSLFTYINDNKLGYPTEVFILSNILSMISLIFTG